MTNQEEVENLLKQPWKSIVSSGGKIGKKVSQNTYLAFGNIIFQTPNKWLYIVSSEVAFGTGRDDYEFFIEIDKADFPLDPKSAKMNNPRLEEILNFPEDCRLDYLRDYGIEKVDYKVHPKSYKKYYKELTYGLLLKTPLVITSKNGFLFKIEPSEELPGSLNITMTDQRSGA
ncbi:MAG: hypothetical protein HRU43_00140 [Simkaniaceae bacterium]|nr:hypothetical protein [Simkaniaceae bacterium]